MEYHLIIYKVVILMFPKPNAKFRSKGIMQYFKLVFVISDTNF